LLPALEDDEEFSISKEVLQELPADYEETSLGELRGAIRQYRGPSGLHVREYNDRFVIHQDSVDPRSDPIGHLLFDAPETALALTTAFCFASRRRRNPLTGVVEQDRESYSPLLSRPFLFLSAFMSLNHVFKFVKRLLF
jgi:hypothetical protein